MKIIGLAIAKILILGATLPLHAAENSDSAVQLTYSASQIQCGAGAGYMTIGVDVYDNGELVAEDMRVNDSVMVSGLSNVTLNYVVVAGEGGCELTTPTELLVTQDADIPNLSGAYAQDSIATLLSEIETYEDLLLVELGTTDTSSFAYDMQDVIFIVNNEPDLQDFPEEDRVVLYAD